MFSRVIAFAFIASSLAAQNVKVNWDRSAFFSNFKTYKWMPPAEGDGTNPQIVDTIVSQTSLQLEAKGVAKSRTDQADILVAYQTSIDKPIAPPSSGSSAPYQPGPSWNGKTESLPVGTLLINLYDSKSKALVWRALITEQVGESRPSDKVKIAKGISKAFAQYPPMGK